MRAYRWCVQGHPHYTEEARNACNERYFDRSAALRALLQGMRY